MKSVRSTSSSRSSARKRSTPNVFANTIGARLEPPIPSRTNVSNCCETRSANSSSSGMRSRSRCGSSSHPSHFASSLPVQSVASRDQMRSTTSVPVTLMPQLRFARSGLAAQTDARAEPARPEVGVASAASCRCGYELAALRADPVEQLLERIGELLHALLLEGRDDVVVVDARGGEIVQKAARLVN